MSNSRREVAARHARSLRRRPDIVPTPRAAEERIAALAADAGAPVDDVLREVADFRLALETDLLIAAAALDVEEADLAAGVLDDERAELADFRERVLERLADAAAAEEQERPARRSGLGHLTRATWLVAAAASVVALLSGTLVVRSRPAETPVATEQVAKAETQFDALSRATLRDDEAGAVEAADELHATLRQLIAEHADDPKVANQIAMLLTNDLALITSQPELHEALNDAIRLVRQLSRNAPPKVRATVAPLIAAVTPTESKSPAPKSSTKPSPKPSQSPSSSSSPSPSPSPSPSSSSNGAGGSGDSDDDSGPLPSPPTL